MIEVIEMDGETVTGEGGKESAITTRPENHGSSHSGVRRVLVLTVATNLSMYGLLGLEAVGLGDPMLRTVVTIVFLLLLPGYLFLLALQPSGLGRVDTALYSLGLGVTLLMFVGALTNVAYPLMGVAKPISLVPIIVTESLVTSALSVVVYRRRSEFVVTAPRRIDAQPPAPVLFLLLLPILSALGTYLAARGDIVVLMILLPVISLVPVAAIITKLIPERIYPLAVLSCALSLLLQNALVSNHLWGWDIEAEYYLANLVAQHGVWNPAVPLPTNGMLSVVILAPAMSVVSGLDLTWTLKLIYPGLLSLVPVVVFQVVQKQAGSKVALLSALFVSFLFVFYTEMIQLARQEIAEVFIALILLALVDRRLKAFPKAVLLLGFGGSLAVSHYGTSYLFLIVIIPAWLGLQVTKRKPASGSNKGEPSTENSRNLWPAENPRSVRGSQPNQLGLGFVLTFAALAIAWYIYVSGSSAFVAITQIGSHISGSLITDFFNAQTAQGLSIIVGQTASPLHSTTKWFDVVSQLFVLSGLVGTLLTKKGGRFRREFLSLSVANLALWIGAVGIPYFAGAINTTRIYQLTLLVLAPFFVLGGMTWVELAVRLLARSNPRHHLSNSLKPIAIFLAVFLLLNCGWAYQVANDSPTSLSMNPLLDQPRYNDRDVATATWLAAYIGNGTAFADENRYELLLGSGVRFEYLYANASGTSNGTCLFLATYNVQNGVVLARISSTDLPSGNLPTEYLSIDALTYLRSAVYDDGGSMVVC